uniref:Small ribosomal subunit protein mS26 n=1 Tax=Ascaris lumbricoides TaxID=6252 RepID=A0A0M3HRY9_ASCLU
MMFSARKLYITGAQLSIHAFTTKSNLVTSPVAFDERMMLLPGCTRCALMPSCSHLMSGSPLFTSSIRGMGRRPAKPGKPPILPPAKKVLYNVVHVPWMRAEDVKELLWRRHVYNNAVISLRNVFKQELELKKAAGLGVAALRRQEEEELDQLLAENERRNQEAARRRKEREESEIKAAKEETIKEIEEELIKREQNVQKRTAEVLDMVEFYCQTICFCIFVTDEALLLRFPYTLIAQSVIHSTADVIIQVERSKNFVTAENLDEKLKEALENPVVYDYAIDLQGHKIYSPKPNKYLEGTPTRQRGRQFDVTFGVQKKEPQGQQA